MMMWAAEVIGKSETGHAVKLSVTVDGEPNSDLEARMRGEAQGLMRRHHMVWCNEVTFLKRDLGFERPTPPPEAPPAGAEQEAAAE